MGIGLNSVHLLAAPLARLGDPAGKTVLTLGVQDCAFTHDELVRFLDKHRVPHHPLPPGEVEKTGGFKWLPEADRAQFRNCVHQRTLFRVLGFHAGDIRALDYSAFEGAEIVHDLNTPVGATLHGAFDLVYDGGTLEHVFSVKDCLFNISRLCRVSGMVVSVTPADFINHGFINVNATLYADFFRANGYEEVALKYVAFPSHAGLVLEHYLEFRPDDLHHSLQPFYGTNVFSAFRKTRDGELRVPNQGYYREVWEAPRTATDPRAPSALRRGLVSFMDRHFPLAAVVRGERMIRRGKRVVL
jgi:hypothetical protein